MAKKPLRPRAERRAAERAASKLVKAKLQLAALSPGGSAERPIEVSSASVVEVHAAGLPCVACDGSTRVEEHVAVTAEDERGGARTLRVARVRCPRCGTRRDLYFRIGSPLAS